MLIIDSCCFINNRAIGNALVNVYADDLAEISSFNIFGADNSVEYLSTTGLECDFIALVDPTNQFFPTTACINFDSVVCAIPVGGTPTFAPSDDTPTSSPEISPTAGPTPISLAPIMGSEDMPTILSGSEDMPTIDTQIPSHSPAEGPTSFPMESPTLVYSPALTPSQITPSLITPSIFTPSFFPPSFFTPSVVVSPVQVSSPSGSSAPFDEAIGQPVPVSRLWKFRVSTS